LMSLGDVALLANVSRAAAEQNVTLGEFATMAVERFGARASDQGWLAIVGCLTRADEPGARFLHHVLSVALAGAAARGHADDLGVGT
jgi:hypothetical protein